MEVYPADDIPIATIAEWVAELILHELVEEYEVIAKRYWQITGWDRHQSIRYPSFQYPDKTGTIPTKLCILAAALPQHCSNVAVHETLRDETLRDENTFVRSFVASDHSEAWPEARRLANDTARKLWPGKREKPAEKDQRLLLRVAFLARTLFTDGWLADAVGGSTGPKVKNRGAYLTRILSETTRKRGYDLHELLNAIEIPTRQTDAPVGINTDGLLKDANEVRT